MPTSKSNKGKSALYYATLTIMMAGFALTAGQVQAEENDEVLAVVLIDLAAEAYAADADAAKKERYECETLFSTDIVMTLPVGDDKGEAVFITLHGKTFYTYFVRTGLDYRWLIDGDDDYQIVLGPDMVAGYYDFTGEAGKVIADNNFYCKLEEGE